MRKNEKEKISKCQFKCTYVVVDLINLHNDLKGTVANGRSDQNFIKKEKTSLDIKISPENNIFIAQTFWIFL